MEKSTNPISAIDYITDSSSVPPIIFDDEGSSQQRIKNFTPARIQTRRDLTVLPGSLELCFASGKFDDYCVYLIDQSHHIITPLDSVYFRFLQDWQSFHPDVDLYADFVRVYNLATQYFNRDAFPQIAAIAASYLPDSLLTHFSPKSYLRSAQALYSVLVVLYAGMVAEENKGCRCTYTPDERAVMHEGYPLGKRVKRLGVYQVLRLGVTPEVAAGYSKQVKWKELDAICKSYGF